jgi:hypothetical protein
MDQRSKTYSDSIPSSAPVALVGLALEYKNHPLVFSLPLFVVVAIILVIVASALANKCWVLIVRRHHCRARPPSSPLDGAIDLPSQCAVKSAKQQSNLAVVVAAVAAAAAEALHCQLGTVVAAAARYTITALWYTTYLQ